jgi:iron(III) transport system permease protein
VTPVQIFNGIKEISGNPFPYALVVVTLVSTTLLYLVSKLLFGRANYAMTSKAATTGGAREARGLTALLCTGFFLAVTFLALLPHIGVILVSFAGDWYHTVLPETWTLLHYKNALGHDLTVPSIINSLKYAGLATVFDLVLGVMIAHTIVRTEWRGRHLLDAAAMLPLAVPGLVLAFGYMAMTQEVEIARFVHGIFTPVSWPASLLGLNAWTAGIAHMEKTAITFLLRHLNPANDPTALLVIAYSVRRLPYVVRSAVAGLQQTSYTLEEAAQNLGAPPLRALCKITLPLITANILAGGLLAFSFAMLEVSDSLVLAQRSADYPITKAIFELYQLLGEGRYIASALGVWAMVFLGITILATSRLLGKKMGALFRV